VERKIGIDALAAAAEGQTAAAKLGLNNLFGLFADKAEKELCNATGAVIKTMGLRGREPELKWAPLVEKDRKPFLELDPILTGDIAVMNGMRDLALELTQMTEANTDVEWRLREIIQKIANLKAAAAETREGPTKERGKAIEWMISVCVDVAGGLGWTIHDSIWNNGEVNASGMRAKLDDLVKAIRELEEECQAERNKEIHVL
jgi:hypothetical protein